MPEYVPDGNIVLEMMHGSKLDPFLANFVRYHAEPEQQPALIEFMRTDPTFRQITLFTSLLKNPRELLVSEMRIQELGLANTESLQLRCVAKVPDGHIVWDTGREISCRRRIPETIGETLVGQPLSALIEHPYLPADLPISYFNQNALNWMVTTTMPGWPTRKAA